ncbi:hypothetical protein LRS13_20055 [Svornostia abyssi]|uniref:Uncharacterized protein n=1 Tax=Svornostia abyssi TaxID=2898438 RepID=A0ABY5PE60_9ACTN|nr:hypothetical protein LRS13_20055 [Parviterribacteraceae bacterium J379]
MHAGDPGVVQRLGRLEVDHAHDLALAADREARLRDDVADDLHEVGRTADVMFDGRLTRPEGAADDARRLRQAVEDLQIAADGLAAQPAPALEVDTRQGARHLGEMVDDRPAGGGDVRGGGESVADRGRH